MIIEGDPYLQQHRRLSIQEVSEYYESARDASNFEIQTMTSVMRSEDVAKRLLLSYHCFPADSPMVQLVDELHTPIDFWNNAAKFSQLGLKLSRIVEGSKWEPKILHSHVSNTKFTDVEDFFVGEYEHLWIGSPGLGRGVSPTILDSFDSDRLDNEHENRVSRTFVSQSRRNSDPWQDETRIANLLIIRVAAESENLLGDFWVYCPNFVNTSLQTTVNDGVALVKAQGFEPVFVSNPVALWRDELRGVKGVWVNFDVPLEVSRLKTILGNLGYA